MNAVPQPALPLDRLRELIRYATLAPSGHNAQPWRFVVRDNVIRLLPDFSRERDVVDPESRELYIGLGCALENLLIAAPTLGYDAEPAYFTEQAPDGVEVRLTPAAPRPDALAEAIPRRHVNRRVYDHRSLPAEIRAALELAAEGDDVATHLFERAEQIEPLIEFAQDAVRAQFGDPEFRRELKHWTRFNGREAENERDGVATAALGVAAMPRWLGRKLLDVVATPEGEARRVEALMRNASALMLFTAPRNDRRAWINVGRALERVALTATGLGVRYSHLGAICEVAPVRERLARYLDLRGEHPLVLIRLGFAEPMPASPRRTAEAFIE